MMERRHFKTPAERRREDPSSRYFTDHPRLVDLDEIVSDYLDVRIEEMRGAVSMYLERCQSPIEQLLAIDLVLAMWMSDGIIQRVMPQWEIETDEGKFRVDFAIEAGGVPWAPKLVRIVVECDGHEFHEKTKEQAQRDKARDRALQRAGWVVLRYTGSEIFHRPWDVMADIRRTIDELTGFNAHIQEQLARSFPEWFGDGDRSAR